MYHYPPLFKSSKTWGHFLSQVFQTNNPHKANRMALPCPGFTRNSELGQDSLASNMRLKDKKGKVRKRIVC